MAEESGGDDLGGEGAARPKPPRVLLRVLAGVALAAALFWALRGLDVRTLWPRSPARDWDGWRWGGPQPRGRLLSGRPLAGSRAAARARGDARLRVQGHGRGVRGLGRGSGARGGPRSNAMVCPGAPGFPGRRSRARSCSITWSTPSGSSSAWPCCPTSCRSAWIRRSIGGLLIAFAAVVTLILVVRPSADAGATVSRGGRTGPRPESAGRVRLGLAATNHPRALAGSFLSSLGSWTLEVYVNRRRP